MTSQTRQGITALNGADIYYEVRGEGPPLLFISGAFGDGGGWERVGELLADSYTVISYDRRGNSRSLPPDGWASTSLDQQAADAVALVDFLGLDHVSIWANSLGGAIGLTLLLQRPDLIRKAMLHEPFVPALLEDPVAAAGPILEVTGPPLTQGDLRGAGEAMIRLMCGDATYEALPATQLDRMLGNGPTLFGLEVVGLSEIATTITPTVPVTVAHGAESPAFLTAGARRLAQLLRTEPLLVAGGHVPQATHPDALAMAIRNQLDPAGQPAMRRIQRRAQHAPASE